MTSYERWREDVADLALDSAPLAIFDTETTGFHFYGASRDRVISLCVLHASIADDEPVVAFNEYIHPGRTIPESSTRIHGISTKQMDVALELGQAFPFRFVAGDVLAAFKGRIQIAHNLDFDAKALRNEFRKPKPGPGWVPRGVCTVALSWAAWPHAENHKLGTLCELIGFELDNAHEAQADSVACFRVLRAAVAELRLKGALETVGDLIAAQEQGAAIRRRDRQFHGGR